MINAANHMAVMSAAMRMLPAGDRLAKPDDLLIAAASEVSGPIIGMMMSHAAHRRATFLALFQVEDDTALLEKIMFVDGSTRKGEIKIGAGKFAQTADGSFAILSINRDGPYEYRFSRGGGRLERRAVRDDSNCSAMDMREMQALLAEAATPACRAEPSFASISDC